MIERGMFALCFLAVLVAVVPLVSVLYEVAANGAPVVNWHFLTSLPRGTSSEGGIGNAIEGTILIVAVAAVIGVPVGVGAGVYMSERMVTPLARATRFTAEVLSGLPSIVAGVVAYGLGTFSALLGGLALSFLFVPLVAIATPEALQLVPRYQREAGLALGLSEAATTQRIILPSAMGAVITGVMLAVARVAGETAPLLFTIGSLNFWPTRIDGPSAALSVTIYNYALSPFAVWKAQAWGAALVLVTLVLVTNVVVRLLWMRRRRFMRGLVRG
jgi:phosphate transport system permease protein